MNDFTKLRIQAPRALARFSPDSALACVVENSSLRVCDLDSGSTVFQKTEARPLLDFALIASPDLRLLLVFPTHLELVDPARDEVDGRLEAPFAVEKAVISASDRRAVLVGEAELAVVDLGDLSMVRRARDASATYFHVSSEELMSFKGAEVLVSGPGGERAVRVPGEIALAAACGDRLLLALRDRRLVLVDARSRAVQATCRWHAQGSLALALDALGRAFSAGLEQVLLAWEPSSGRTDFLPRLGAAPRHVEASPDGRFVALSLADNSALVVDSQSFRPVLAAKGVWLPAGQACLGRAVMAAAPGAGRLELTRLTATGLATSAVRVGELGPGLFDLSLDGRFLASHQAAGDFCWLKFFEVGGREEPGLELNNRVRLPRPLVALRAGFDPQSGQNFFLATDARSVRRFALQRDARGQFSFIQAAAQDLPALPGHLDAFLAGGWLALSRPDGVALYRLHEGAFRPAFELALPGATAVEACGSLLAVSSQSELAFVDPEAGKTLDRWRFTSAFRVQGDGKGLLLLSVPKLRSVTLLRDLEVVNRWTLPFADVTGLWLAGGHSLVAFAHSGEVAIFDFDFKSAEKTHYVPVHQELAERREAETLDLAPRLGCPKLAQLMEFNEQSALLPNTEYFADKLFDLCLPAKLI